MAGWVVWRRHRSSAPTKTRRTHLHELLPPVGKRHRRRNDAVLEEPADSGVDFERVRLGPGEVPRRDSDGDGAHDDVATVIQSVHPEFERSASRRARLRSSVGVAVDARDVAVAIVRTRVRVDRFPAVGRRCAVDQEALVTGDFLEPLA